MANNREGAMTPAADGLGIGGGVYNLGTFSFDELTDIAPGRCWCRLGVRPLRPRIPAPSAHPWRERMWRLADTERSSS
jgi:hypothetical protein